MSSRSIVQFVLLGIDRTIQSIWRQKIMWELIDDVVDPFCNSNLAKRSIYLTWISLVFARCWMLRTTIFVFVVWVLVDAKTFRAIGTLVMDFFFLLRGFSTVWSLGCDFLDFLLLVNVPSSPSFFGSSSMFLVSSWFCSSKVRCFFTPFIHLWSWEVGCGSCSRPWPSAFLSLFFSIWMGEVTSLNYNVSFVTRSLMLPTDRLIVFDLVCSRHH